MRAHRTVRVGQVEVAPRVMEILFLVVYTVAALEEQHALSLGGGTGTPKLAQVEFPRNGVCEGLVFISLNTFFGVELRCWV